MRELIAVQIYLDRNEAEIAKGLLAQNGIQSTISSDDAGGYRPNLVFGMGGIKLLVEKNDLKEAKEILDFTENNQEDEEFNNFKMQIKIKNLPLFYCALIFLLLLMVVFIIAIFSPQLREGRPVFIFLAVGLGLLFIPFTRELRTVLAHKKKMKE